MITGCGCLKQTLNNDIFTGLAASGHKGAKGCNGIEGKCNYYGKNITLNN
jgi:hypothetical protein